MSRRTMTPETTLSGGCALAWVAIMAAGAIGWALNIIKIFGALGEPVTGMFIGRVIGAFVVPIGCIVGWL